MQARRISLADHFKEICRFASRLGSITAGSQFVWQECGNLRAVFIDEAQFPTEYLEKLKQMTAGKGCSAGNVVELSNESDSETEKEHLNMKVTVTDRLVTQMKKPV